MISGVYFIVGAASYISHELAGFEIDVDKTCAYMAVGGIAMLACYMVLKLSSPTAASQTI